MQPTSKDNNLLLLQAFTLASLAVLALFAWQGHKGFNLWDEGFLWYGAQHVMRGDVPMRDFFAYDPGRYYWSAGLMSLWGNDGIVSLRATSAIASAIGVFVALCCIARTLPRPEPLFLLVSAVTLVAWMFPRHALIDSALEIILIGALAFLVERPTAKRYFLAGLCVGLVAVFGRNHGVYGAVAMVGAMLWLGIKRTEGPNLVKAFALWAGGVTIGYSPILFMALLVPGFASAFWDSVAFLFEVKSASLPTPTPWPWRADFSAPFGDAARAVLLGLFYMSIVAFALLSLPWVVRQRFAGRYVSPALVAASFLALPYLHRAFSRASNALLAQSIFPLLIGCLVLLAPLRARIRWPLAAILCVTSWFVMHVYQEGWPCRAGQPCTSVEISGDLIQVPPYAAFDIDLLRNMAAEYAPDGQSFIAMPFWPGAYALLDRKAPMWEIFALFPRSAAFEEAEIARMRAAKPGFVVIFDHVLDGLEERRFRNTHPLTYRYIQENFEPLESAHPTYLLYKAKPAAP